MSHMQAVLSTDEVASKWVCTRFMLTLEILRLCKSNGFVLDWRRDVRVSKICKSPTESVNKGVYIVSFQAQIIQLASDLHGKI